MALMWSKLDLDDERLIVPKGSLKIDKYPGYLQEQKGYI